jgi:hypothetical protein
MKERLQGVAVTLDPLQLLDEIRAVQRHLADLDPGTRNVMLPAREPDLEKFLASLAVAWREGEVRPTHHPKPPAQRYWRTRKDPFATVWPRVRAWFDAKPDTTATELLKRLQLEYPNEFPDAQLRTLQRRVKEWRREVARRLVFANPERAAINIDNRSSVSDHGSTAETGGPS